MHCVELSYVGHCQGSQCVRAAALVLRLAAHAQGADVAAYTCLVRREQPSTSLGDDGETEQQLEHEPVPPAKLQQAAGEEREEGREKGGLLTAKLAWF